MSTQPKYKYITQYFPWSNNEAVPLIENAHKELGILDLQLGAICNARCIYCDTPRREEAFELDLLSIEKLLNSGKISWVYICGLGEPTAGRNMTYLKILLEMCKKRGIKVSMFSNMINLDQKLLSYIDSGTLHVLFKLDSFKNEKIKHLYGIDAGDRFRTNYDKLREVVHLEAGTTNLGASIVPTQTNLKELPQIIEWCLENGIYPLLGQLEKAGDGSSIFDSLMLPDDDLLTIKSHVESLCGEDYKIPICPSAIASMHVDVNGQIVVDRSTGLSCPWYSLGEPQIETIGSISALDYFGAVERINKYRQGKTADVKIMLENAHAFPIGGCGGNPSELLPRYAKVLSRLNG